MNRIKHLTEIFDKEQSDELPDFINDITGTVLLPGQPDQCPGNGNTKNIYGDMIDCCCDECDYLISCLAKTALQKPE